MFVLQARPAERFALTIDNIMRGPGLVGYEPAQVRWSFDSAHVYFQWKQSTDKLDAPLDTYTANRDGSGFRELTDEEVKALPLPAGDTSKDKRYTIYSRDGDVFIYDTDTGKIRQVTKTAETESNPHFLPDGKRIYFTRANNFYVLSLETGFLEQMSDIRSPAAPVRRRCYGRDRRRTRPGRRPRRLRGVGAVKAEARQSGIGHSRGTDRQRQPGVSQEGAEGAVPDRSRTDRAPPRGRGEKEEGAAAQTFHPAGPANRGRAATQPR